MIVLIKKEMVKQDFHLECKHLPSCIHAQSICFSDRAGRRGSQGKQKDDCIARIALGKMFYPSQILTWWFYLGKHVTGDKERDHYRSVCGTPRQVFSMWHTLG